MTAALPLLFCVGLPGKDMVDQAGVPLVPTGPAIGTRVPDFKAADQNGKEQSLRAILGPKGALLVFFRSADW